MKLVIRNILVGLLMTLLVFLPAVAQDSTAIPMTPFTDEGYGISGVVPEGWRADGPGLMARGQSSNDFTLVIQQVAPASAAAVLQSVLPRLGLQTAPESVGTHQGTALNWTLYKVDVKANTLLITVDMALSEVDSKTYIAMMQTSPEEYDTLHAGVFLPMLDAMTPLTAEATEAVPYIEEDVMFPSGDHMLAGTLTLPEGNGPFPVVVLVTGSGPQDRDESLNPVAAIKPFRLIADALTREGVAVLRYDDRGIGKSTGDFATATTADFADDATAAIDYLLTRDEIDSDQIGLLGHSEGGMVAAMLAANNPNLAFVISMAGVAVSGRDISLFQNEHGLDLRGATAEQKEQMMAAVSKSFDQAQAGDATAAQQTIRDATLAYLQSLPADQKSAMGNLETIADQAATQQGAAFSSPWFRFWLTYNAADDWAKTTIPVLAFFGGKDTQVDVTLNDAPLKAALEEAGNTDFTIVTIPDANHLFQAATTGEVGEYGTLKQEFTADFLPTLTEWVLKHVTLANG